MDDTRACRDERFYLASLSYAQSQWLAGKPAQALLQINKAFMADLPADSSVFADWPPPYLAKAWILRNSDVESGFLGNPVRHYQHLATRMNAVNTVPRHWRAWGCFHLASHILGPAFARDELQIERERVIIPGEDEVARGLEETGWENESAIWRESFLLDCAR